MIRNIHTICFYVRNIQRYDISHIHACFLSWPACIGLAVAKMAKKPFSIAAHARDIFVEHGAIELKISQAKFVVCCTKQGLDFIKSKVPPEYHNKLYLNYHGLKINSESIEFNKTSSKNNVTIVAVGRLIRKKGFASLVEVFADIVKEKLQCNLIIAGDGPEYNNLSKVIKGLNLTENVHLVGWHDHKEVLRLICQATALVAPSIIDDDGDRDGIPNVILEAFYLKTPVIASALEGITEAVRNEQTGLLVEPGNKKQLGLALERLLSDRVLGQRISNNAYETIKRDFNAIQNCCNLKNLFLNTN